MHPLRLVLLTEAFALISQPAQAEVMERFTQSMSSLYSISMRCEDTLTPSPNYYAKSIVHYLHQYYNDVQEQFWVLPKVNAHSNDPVYCKILVERHLLSYQIARNEFQIAYAHLPSPPELRLLTSRPNTHRGRVVVAPEIPSALTTSTPKRRFE